MNYHLVLVVKYRNKVFEDIISDRAKEIFEYIAPNYNITLLEWNHDEDHVHIFFKAHPKTAISKSEIIILCVVAVLFYFL
jgi:putative transposase